MRTIRKTLQSVSVELYISALAVIFVFIGLSLVTYTSFSKDLTSKDTIMNRNDTGVILLDRNDKPYFSFYQGRTRTFVPLSKIPLIMQEAVIVSEDKNFYSHPGFSFSGIIRSLFHNIQQRDSLYGGSTITQQLVKNSLLTPKRDILRKYQELVLAQEIERRYAKKEILEMYLNSVYFGEGAFGVENASEKYFGKPITQISTPEAALLAGILPAPTKYSPLNGELSEATRLEHIVLGKLYSTHDISKQDYDQASQTKLVFKPNTESINANAMHFALMVRDQLIKQYGEEQIARSGFQVKTSLDLQKQQYAEKAVQDQVALLAKDTVSNGAAVVMDPKTGEILALVGSKDWYDPKFGKVNMATTPRSPGSSFKPIVYSLAFEKRLITPATILKDIPTTFPENYRPLDYDRRFRGDVTVRRALANSLNIPAVQVLQRVGVPDAVEMAKRLGVTSFDDKNAYGLSLVLGTGEVSLLDMTDVYSNFANNGKHNPPVAILSIKDKTGNEISHYTPKPKKVLEPGIAYLISSILSDNRTRAEEFGNALTISRPAAVKTGTAEDYRDALTIGYTPSLVVGIWVGNNDNASMDQIAGSLGAAPIWKRLMEHFLENTRVEAFSRPEDVHVALTCRSTTNASVSAYFSTQEYFLDGTGSTRYCPSRLSEQSIPSSTAFPMLTVTPNPSLGGEKKHDTDTNQ